MTIRLEAELICSWMAKYLHGLLLVLFITSLVTENEAASPFFLQAITSALSTIPFSAGPMTTGLMGAKLAVGSKLLYYLGFFGRRRSKPKPKETLSSKQNLGVRRGQVPFNAAMQPSPFQQGGFGTGGFGAGGFPQQFGGMGGFGGYPYGYDPAQMFQMLAAQGIDPATAMQAMNFDAPAGGGGSIPSSQFPFPAGSGSAGMNMPTGGGFMNMPQAQMPVQGQSAQNVEEDGESEVESFFAFLKDMDDNKCISRLMCDIGANPSFLGEFSENIHGIVSSLDVLPTSGAHQYIGIMQAGKNQGGCSQRFSQCNDGAYEVVKNVAPSVNMPQNINIDAINQL